MDIVEAQIKELATELGNRLTRCNWQVTTAESCTGGAVAVAITDIPGSSAWFDRSFITYSNRAKIEMLAVNEASLTQHGAVSQTVVVEMALGALTHSSATISVAISGIAGPDGGSADKPVGTVWFAWANQQGYHHTSTHIFHGDRHAVRQQAVKEALSGLIDLLL